MGDMISDGRGEAGGPARKPLLDVERQIALLKSKGVTFEACDERHAAEYLRLNNYLRTASYRALYPRQVDGDSPGAYVGLDFAALVALSRVDRRLREALLLAAVDVEHFAKVKVLNLATDHGEDGYGVVEGYWASLGHDRRNRVRRGLAARAASGEGHDTYTGDLIAHHGVEALPLQVLVEVLEFGPFLTLYKCCAERWDDPDMLQEHYVLKSVKAIRNAAAHGSCIVNGFAVGGEDAAFRTPELITRSLNESGMRNGHVRRAKMRNLRVAQITALLYSVSSLCPEGPSRSRHARRFAELRAYVRDCGLRDLSNDRVMSFFDFLWRLVDIWVPDGR